MPGPYRVLRRWPPIFSASACVPASLVGTPRTSAIPCDRMRLMRWDAAVDGGDDDADNDDDDDGDDDS